MHKWWPVIIILKIFCLSEHECFFVYLLHVRFIFICVLLHLIGRPKIQFKVSGEQWWATLVLTMKTTSSQWLTATLNGPLMSKALWWTGSRQLLITTCHWKKTSWADQPPQNLSEADSKLKILTTRHVYSFLNKSYLMVSWGLSAHVKWIKNWPGL